MSASDIHSPELLGLPVSLPTSHFSEGSGHSQGIKGWYRPPCWPGELTRSFQAQVSSLVKVQQFSLGELCCFSGAAPGGIV